MADNITLNAGAGGDPLAADEIAGVKHQRVKVQHGADGAATDVSTASPLPVTLADTGANATAVKVDGSAVTQPVSAAALPLPAGAATDAGLAAIAGYLDTETAAMVASLALLDNAISGNEMQVDVVSSALPAGAATEATLAAQSAKITACNTGAVTVAASALPAGAATEATLAAQSAKITACNTGAVTVAASALPAGAATEATLAAQSAKITACNTGAVTVAASALPAGAATEATLAAQSAKITACNTGAVTIAAALPAGGNTLGTVLAQTRLNSSLMYDGATACVIKRANVVVAADAAVVLAAVADKKFRILAMALTAVSTTVTNLYLEDADGADVYGSATGLLPLGVNADGDMISGLVLPWNPGGWFETPTANKNLVAKLSAAQPVVITVTYIEVA